MTDDPCKVLREAGIECPEVDNYMAYKWHVLGQVPVAADAAILAVARLAAKHKWVATKDAARNFDALPIVFDRDELVVAHLDRRWEEHDG